MVLWSFGHPWDHFTPRCLSVSLWFIVDLLLMSWGLSQGGIAMGSAWQCSSNMKTHTNTHIQTRKHPSPREPGVCFNQMWAISIETHAHMHAHNATYSQLLHLVIYHAFVCVDTQSHTHTHKQQSLHYKPQRSRTYVFSLTTGECGEAGG